jgi:hypothetical protein
MAIERLTTEVGDLLTTESGNAIWTEASAYATERYPLIVRSAQIFPLDYIPPDPPEPGDYSPSLDFSDDRNSQYL